MYLEKREEEDLPASKTALTHQYNGSKATWKKHQRGLITAIRNDTDNTIDDRMTTTRKENGRKTTLWPVSTTYKQDLTPENLDLA